MTKEQRLIHPHIWPEIEDWPIYRLHQDRVRFVREIESFTLQRFLDNYRPDQINDLLAKTIYLERIRIKEEPWKVDPPKEKQFWRRIQKAMVTGMDQPTTANFQNDQELLGRIVHRYAEEIVGTFRKKTFLFARRFLTFFFTTLLNSAGFIHLRKNKYQLSDRLLVSGKLDEIRSLMTKGTVVLVPTHFSNLDSILIGYAIDSFVGLPGFLYGAGLNLYNTGYVAYFMNRIGTYRIDRRKKNPIYLETLKAMSNLAVQRGTNILFFPGGTRSRSGSLESHVKLGLLSTAVEAQRSLYQQGRDKKVFVVPLVLSYHIVLEAQFLIEQHLRKMGKERYIRVRDDFGSLRRILRFAWQVFSQGNEVRLSFGQPLDVLGNPVDTEGKSLDQSGRPIDLKAYFLHGGVVNTDLQRESEYTKMLGKAIVERYFKDNIVLTSHLVAYAAFRQLQAENRRLDLYGLLRLPTDEFVFDREKLEQRVSILREHLFSMANASQIRLSPEISWEIGDLIQDGIKRLGTFHVKRPLKVDKSGKIRSDSFKLLYYYHNRLDHYGLEKIGWRMVMPQIKPISVT